MKMNFMTMSLVAFYSMTAYAQDVLPSWNDTATKIALIDFVSKVTQEGGKDFVPEKDRIAVFDNDGTLWSEQPYYVQVAFAFDRIHQLAPKHPEWKSKQPYKAVLEGDMEALKEAGEHGLVEIIMATHAGMTTDEFSTIVNEWMKTARHPVTKKPYTKMVYQPMLEVLEYLKANNFKTFIVSGGGIEFMRPWTYETYGIPPERVVGSSVKTQFQMKNGKPVLTRLAQVNFIDDKEGKPVGILQHIGQKPIAAFGNSDGDLQMLQWTTSGDGARFGLIVHHTDGEREVAYDRDSAIGRLDKALEQAKKNNWTVVDMRQDWNVIFPE